MISRSFVMIVSWFLSVACAIARPSKVGHLLFGSPGKAATWRAAEQLRPRAESPVDADVAGAGSNAERDGGAEQDRRARSNQWYDPGQRHGNGPCGETGDDRRLQRLRAIDVLETLAHEAPSRDVTECRSGYRRRERQ